MDHGVYFDATLTAYDYFAGRDPAVYGYFATVIGSQFFPSSDPAVSLIAAFGAVAAGIVPVRCRMPNVPPMMKMNKMMSADCSSPRGIAERTPGRREAPP